MEFVPENEANQPLGHAINASTLRRTLFLLMSLIMASEPISIQSRKDQLCPFGSLIHEFFFDQLTEYLIESSIKLRMYMETYKPLDSEEYPCGFLIIEGNRETEIYIREACNKIIHAERVRLDLEEGGTSINYIEGVYNNPPYANPVIYLYGNHVNGKEWKAVINIIEYVRRASLLTLKDADINPL